MSITSNPREVIAMLLRRARVTDQPLSVVVSRYCKVEEPGSAIALATVALCALRDTEEQATLVLQKYNEVIADIQALTRELQALHAHIADKVGGEDA